MVRYQRIRVVHIAQHVLLLYITRKLFSDVCIKLCKCIQRLILFVRNLMDRHILPEMIGFSTLYILIKF